MHETQVYAERVTGLELTDEQTRALFASTGGVPFLIEQNVTAEVKGGDLADGPALGNDTERLLACAATIGSTFSYALVANAAGESPESAHTGLEPAIRGAVLSSEGDELLFTQSLWRSRYESDDYASASERAEWNRRARSGSRTLVGLRGRRG